MKLRAGPAAWVFFLAVSLARASAAQMSTLATSADQDGRRYVYEISQDRADALPQWDQQATPDPPLSMGEATKAARAWLTSRTPEIKIFELSALNLLNVPARPGTCRRGCWFYRMNFNPVIGGRRLAGGGDFTVVVLMDGSIVEPRLEAAPSGPVGGGAGGGVPGSGTGGGSGPRAFRVPSPDAQGVYAPGNGVIPPQVVRQTKAQYTREALRAKIQGAVWLELVVNTDGTVGDVKVVRSLDPVYGLDQEAVKTAKEWRFAPGTLNGMAVPVRVQVEMTFSSY